MGFLEILTIVFVCAKLFGAIAWSWWWVLAPIWIPISIILVVFVIVGTLYVAENNKNK